MGKLPNCLRGDLIQNLDDDSFFLVQRISSSSDDTSDSVEPIDPYQQQSLPSLPAYSRTYPDYSNYDSIEGNRRFVISVNSFSV